MSKRAVYNRVLCPAKLNLILRIGPLRRDGYHELESLMVPLDWGDRLSLRAETSTRTSIHFVCRGLKGLDPEKNLAYRAAQAFCRVFRRPLRVSIRLEKRVPIGAGLGGGSSDAATVLLLLARICGIRSTDSRLVRLASSLGADVPLFLYESAAWCTGFGQKVQPIRMKRRLHFVLVHSRKSPIPTGWAYQTLDRDRERDRGLQKFLRGYPAWLETHWEVPLLENDFEEIAFKRHPVLREVSRALCLVGSQAVRMSGSGSSFFGVFESLKGAQKAARILRGRGFEAQSCSALS